jgi:hypothetical protein
MRRAEPGKLRRWFDAACWSIVSLDDFADAMSLVCVDNWETRRSGLVRGDRPDCQVMSVVVRAALETRYFDNREVLRTNSVEAHFRQERINAFRKTWPAFRDEERITICDLNPDEKAQNPSGTYYLHDGYGRLLAYLYAIAYEGREYLPIEAFLAQARSGDNPETPPR